MYSPGKAGFRGALAGATAGVLLLSLFLGWTRSSPSAHEGAYDAITVTAYVLGFPVSFGLDRLLAAIEAVGPKYIMSTLAVSLLSLPLNWCLVGFLVAIVRSPDGRRTRA